MIDANWLALEQRIKKLVQTLRVIEASYNKTMNLCEVLARGLSYGETAMILSESRYSARGRLHFGAKAARAFPPAPGR